MGLAKVLVTDLDGTLLNSQREISEENRAALQFVQEQGTEIIIATGRTYADARAICEKAAISAHIISNNGAFVHSKQGEKLQKITMEKKLIHAALQWLHENEYYYEIATDSAVYLCPNHKSVLEVDFHKAQNCDLLLTSNMLGDILKLQLSQESVSLVNTIEEIVDADADYCNILSISFDKSKLRRGKEYFRNHAGLSLISSHPLNFELVGASASKGNALAYLSGHLNIPLEHVMVIGDNYNDISMFEKAGISVAMGNADADIKKLCSYVSLSNDQHGVAHAIHHYKHLLL